MAEPLVEQLRFTRSEWQRALRGVPEEDGGRRLEPMNSIGWIVAHLAWQEQRYWLTRAQDRTPLPMLNEVAAYGGPPTTPSLKDMRAAWLRVTREVDAWLDGLDHADIAAPLPGSGPRRSIGDSLHRVMYHYWFHIGEILAIRQLLGHASLPEFVSLGLEARAPYRPEQA
jgi:hypothetical protein